jgi:hypothetical protein
MPTTHIGYNSGIYTCFLFLMFNVTILDQDMGVDLGKGGIGVISVCTLVST